MRSTRTLAAGLAAALAPLLLAATACGGTGDGSGGGPAGAGVPAPGGELSVGEALRSSGAEPVLVRGHLVADDGGVRLCAALAESSPPRCGEESLEVDGLDLGAVEGTTTLHGVTWTDRAVVLAGTVAGGVLTIRPTAL